jgi:hypothetical protein
VTATVRARAGLAALTLVSTFGVLVTLPPAPAGAMTATADRATSLFLVRDRAIDESSGLARRSRLFVTTNDSGDTGRLFVLNRRGRTVGITHWSDRALDTEALAPAGRRSVWVGDIGDNQKSRSSISISRVPVGRGQRDVRPQTFRLAYPRGPADAETLIRNPRTGRLYVATKDAFGGTLYAVPRRPSRSQVNVLRPVGPVLGTATDGAFLPGGRFLVVRSYSQASLYRWPSMTSLGSFSLPGQRQGEGIAAGRHGVLFLCSEGLRQPVLRMLLPNGLRRTVEAATPEA